MQPEIDAGRLVAIGVVQEQHADRARLYKQWRRLGWPIAVDALNTLGFRVVPIPMGLDESGVIRRVKMKPEELDAFLKTEWEAPEMPEGHGRMPDLAACREQAKTPAVPPDAEGALLFQIPADARFLWGKTDEALDLAISDYTAAVRADPKDAVYQFRLGVALRRRADSPRARPGDAQAAIAAWTAALALEPNQYIWRRRIQQYGPRLDKPYNFFFWVEEARADIRARGEEPLPLVSEPRGSEIAPPPEGAAAPPALVNRDPKNEIVRDQTGMVVIDPSVAPSPVRPGASARARITFRLRAEKTPWWNNEADPLSVFLDLPEGLALTDGALVFANETDPETRGTRVLEVEIAVAEGVAAGPLEVPGYALYSVCEDTGGVCLYLRQDFTVTVRVDPAAPKLGR